MSCKQVIQPTVIRPLGSLNHNNVAALQQQLADLLLDSPKICVLDMTHIDFIDNSGLLSLIAGLKAARQQQCRLAICNLQPSVRISLEIAQIDLVFDIFESLEAALAILT